MHGIIREAGAASSGVLPGTIKLDEAFTQGVDAWRVCDSDRPVVHVATTFILSAMRPNSACCWVMAAPESGADQESANVIGGVELLTLSAVQYATGGSGANGKEVEGFAVLANGRERSRSRQPVASCRSSTRLLMQSSIVRGSAKWRIQDRRAARRAIETVARRDHG